MKLNTFILQIWLHLETLQHPLWHSIHFLPLLTNCLFTTSWIYNSLYTRPTDTILYYIRPTDFCLLFHTLLCARMHAKSIVYKYNYNIPNVIFNKSVATQHGWFPMQVLTISSTIQSYTSYRDCTVTKIRKTDFL